MPVGIGVVLGNAAQRPASAAPEYSRSAKHASAHSGGRASGPGYAACNTRPRAGLAATSARPRHRNRTPRSISTPSHQPDGVCASIKSQGSHSACKTSPPSDSSSRFAKHVPKCCHQDSPSRSALPNCSAACSRSKATSRRNRARQAASRNSAQQKRGL